MNTSKRVWSAAALGLALSATPMTAANSAEDPPNRHNMLVVGRDSVFLSHLPMFEQLNRTGYISPHRFQVILQATFLKPADVTDVYKRDRKGNPGVRMYTLQPELFVLSRLFTPSAEPALKSFTATVFRGHLERGGEAIEGLNDVTVQVEKVLYANQFHTPAEPLRKLTYILFGQHDDFYLAHMITRPPDFDQIISVDLSGHQPRDEELARGVSIVLDRDNTASQRLKPGEQPQQAKGEFRLPTRLLPFDIQVQPGIEYYFEQGELAIPADFKQTDEERKAGF